MDEITLDQAIELFQLPRTLGTWDDGHPIKVAVGRFGPYVQYGAKKYASLKKEDDPYTITRERALQLIFEKQQVEANRIIREFDGAGIQVLNGRYGPYISDGKKNGRIPKDRDPKSLTLEECQALLAAAPERRGGWGRKAVGKTTGKTASADSAAAATTATTVAAKATPAAKAPAPKKKKKKKAAVKKKTTAKKRAAKAS
jgi:DNA topoisomerase-1